MSDYGNLQKACQRGSTSIAAANNLLAECHAALGKLIAENEELGRYLCTCRDCGGEGSLHTGDWHSYSHMEPPEPVMEKCGECDGTGLLGEIQDLHQLITDRDQLRAEIDDLKAESVRLTEGCSELRGLFADAAEQCCKAERERDQLKGENEELRSVMSAVTNEKPRGKFIQPGNAPGHCHDVPGIWDQGNGDKAGKECGWCKVWNAAVTMSKELKD